MRKEENHFNKFKSSMPPHLSLEEQEEWIKEEEWNHQEKERRRREGFYPGEETQGIVSRIIKKFNCKTKKWDDPTIYGP